MSGAALVTGAAGGIGRAVVQRLEARRLRRARGRRRRRRPDHPRGQPRGRRLGARALRPPGRDRGQRRRPARVRGRRVPRGQVGPADLADARPARSCWPATAGRPWARRPTAAASSPSPPPTRWPPRPTSPPTCRPSTACWAWSRRWPWRAPSRAPWPRRCAPRSCARRWSRSRSPTRPRPTASPRTRSLEQVILAPHAVKRLIEPSEVADTVAFLAGPGGATFTGVPVTMDLGWTAGRHPLIVRHRPRRGPRVASHA